MYKFGTTQLFKRNTFLLPLKLLIIVDERSAVNVPHLTIVRALLIAADSAPCQRNNKFNFIMPHSTQYFPRLAAISELETSFPYVRQF